MLPMNTTRPALSLGGILPDFLAVKDVSFGDLCCDRGAFGAGAVVFFELVVYLTSTLEHHQLACALTTLTLFNHPSAIQVYSKTLLGFRPEYAQNGAFAFLVHEMRLCTIYETHHAIMNFLKVRTTFKSPNLIQRTHELILTHASHIYDENAWITIFFEWSQSSTRPLMQWSTTITAVSSAPLHPILL
jgi:hypothetical protein